MDALKNNFTSPKIKKWRINMTSPFSSEHEDVRSKTNTDLTFLVQVYAIFGKLIGIQRIKFTGQKLTEIGKMYKCYALSITIFITALTVWGMLNEMAYLKIVPKAVVFATLLQLAFTMIAHIASILQITLKDTHISLKLCESLDAVDKILHPNMEADIVLFKIGVIAIQMIHLIFMIVMMSGFEVLWSEYIFVNVSFISAYIITVETLNFSVGLNTLARRFQCLNTRLNNFRIFVCEEETDPNDAVKFESDDGILMNIWGKQSYVNFSKTSDKTNKTTEIDVEDLLKVYDKLADIVDNFNSIYGLTVNMTLGFGSRFIKSSIGTGSIKY